MVQACTAGLVSWPSDTVAGVSDDTNLAAFVERDSETSALIVGGRAISYRELSQRLARWRGGLAAAGVRKGDRVAIVAPNGDEFVLAHLATIGIGAISVPLNPQSPPAELARELGVVDPLVAVGGQCRDVVEAAVGQAIGLELEVLTPEVLDSGDPLDVVSVVPSDPAALLFTSGTAGPPKPAILTHGNLAAALQAILTLPVDLVGRPHIFLGVIPLFHVFGLNMVLHLGLLVGATLVLEDFSGPGPTASLIRDHGVTLAAGPPTLWQALARQPDVDEDWFSTIEFAVSGASKLPPQLKLDVESRFGIELDEGYGLTESSAVAAGTLTTDAPLGSVGRILPGVEARIVDQDDQDCLVGDPGELWIRGPMVFAGYWAASPGAPGPLTEDGWLRTGDVAVVDDQGYLAIVDRRKDLIIVSGFNVYPAEVEGVLLAHPDVTSVGVVGEPSEATGEAVVAFVVPEAGTTVDEESLKEHCRRELARYKVPVRIVVSDDLPVGPTGKLLRNRLG